LDWEADLFRLADFSHRFAGSDCGATAFIYYISHSSFWPLAGLRSSHFSAIHRLWSSFCAFAFGFLLWLSPPSGIVYSRFQALRWGSDLPRTRLSVRCSEPARLSRPLLPLQHLHTQTMQQTIWCKRATRAGICELSR